MSYKKNKSLLGPLLLLFISLIACHKTVEKGTKEGDPSTSGSSFVPADREYFWERQWQPTSRGDEIHLNVPRLNDSTIRKGIDVALAVYSDWDVFDKVPFDYYDTNKKDTVHFMYEVTPGELRIIAKASFALTYPSDVYVEYK